jgi:hypothetical protein
VFLELPFSDRKILILTPDGGDAGDSAPLSVVRRCPRCRDAERGGLLLEGIEASFVLGRVMAYDRPGVASPDRVLAAVDVINDTGGPAALVRLLTRHGRPLGDLPEIGSLALEIFGTQVKERALLKLEVASLEARLKEEERLAALVDGELTPVPGLDALLRRYRG